jgi:DNA-binding CsgD family transcriptional regulator
MLTGSIHGPSGRSSKGSLAALGACLVVLPWILMGALDGWGLCLYLVLGFAFTVIMVCLNHRELWGRMQNSSSAPPGRSAAYQHILTARELAIVSKARAKHSNEETAEESFGLHSRELEILTAIVAGYSDQEIARYFKIGEQTVRHCVNGIFRKLRVSTRLDLALFAVKHSLPLKKATSGTAH